MSASEHNCFLVSLTDVTPMSLQRSGRVVYGRLSYVLRDVIQTSQGIGTCIKSSLCPPTLEEGCRKDVGTSQTGTTLHHHWLTHGRDGVIGRRAGPILSDTWPSASGGYCHLFILSTPLPFGTLEVGAGK